MNNARIWTRAEVDALTMDDVAAAKRRYAEARASRSGTTTLDMHLAQVGDTIMGGPWKGRMVTLESAKAGLLRVFGSDGRLED